MRGEKYREQMDQQFSMQRGCNTWPRQGRRHFGWKCEAGSFDRTRIHFRTRDIEDQSYLGTLGFHAKYSLRSTRQRHRSLSTIIIIMIVANRNRTNLLDENTSFLTHSRTGKILIASSCTARYVRVWQCHSRNILEEKPFVDPFSEMQNVCTYRRKREIGAKIKHWNLIVERRRGERARRSVYILT